jgi:hypothetical protein
VTDAWVYTLDVQARLYLCVPSFRALRRRPVRAFGGGGRPSRGGHSGRLGPHTIPARQTFTIYVLEGRTGYRHMFGSRVPQPLYPTQEAARAARELQHGPAAPVTAQPPVEPEVAQLLALMETGITRMEEQTAALREQTQVLRDQAQILQNTLNHMIAAQANQNAVNGPVALRPRRECSRPAARRSR